MRSRFYLAGALACALALAATATFDYRPASLEIVARARQIDGVCRRHGVPLKAAALQFPLGHPVVTSVLTGARTVAELQENVALFRQPIPADLWHELVESGLLAAYHVPIEEPRQG
ncbi:aldo/keto reductase [Jiangella rhizosphaerae]|uniref:NADP-dependent oxidoreductase domain-containing protein n=1 Tax=Jiangella rhizosphaerae TaxID=2293569 RepID=A0A418KHB1_9ACTN|nr:aldo/keto reductase [Jiangella rhizosphaerae]RIQ11342.1 hypothetical protein DY240_29040 [Jiangella rhizosphaerae]